MLQLSFEVLEELLKDYWDHQLLQLLKFGFPLDFIRNCAYYVNMCLPFEMRHESQIFQHLSDAVRYVMHQKGFCVIAYIDNYVGMGVPDITHTSFNTLFQLMGNLGLTISDKKLVAPSTKVVCLGILIDIEKGTVSIPPDKLHQSHTVCQWLTKTSCAKRQLQSIFGMLFYKCVKLAHAF